MADYIIAYDIASPRRLGRIHRALCKIAVPIEYSVFWLTCDPRQIEGHLTRISQLIDGANDDLRCYPLPARGFRKRLGKATFPEGIHYTDLPVAWQEDEE